MKKLWFLSTFIFFYLWGQNQILKKLADKAKEKIENKTDKKIDDASNGKKEEKKNEEIKDTTSTPATNSNQPASIKVYSKYDFVPGERIIVYEDFAKDAIGDFPDKWNTNSSGEIVTIDKNQGHWLMMT